MAADSLSGLKRTVTVRLGQEGLVSLGFCRNPASYPGQ